MTAQAIDLIGGSYNDETKPLSAQETINWMPEIVEVEGARNVKHLRGAPGLQEFGVVGTGPIRGSTTMDDVLYVVSGTSLYSVTDVGNSTLIGTVAGTGRVSMTNNGYQLVIVNGTEGYVYNNQTAVFGQITSPAFQAAYTCDFLDQYIIFDGPDAEFFISELADATTYNALDFASAEASPDGVLAVLVDHLELWVFGTGTIEIYQDTGNPDFPLERIAGVVIERGLGARYTPQQMDNSVYWLGEDGMVYLASGYTPQRISTYPIEQDIQSQDFSTAFAFTYRSKGHWFYVLTLPDGKTWVFDASTKLWHRRKSFQLDRWRANTHSYVYNKHIIGDFEDGTLWELRDDVFTEGYDPFIAERYTQVTHASQAPLFCHSMELVMDTGHGETNDPYLDPIIDMRFSDDGGRNWSTYKQRSLGKIGQYGKRVKYPRLGRFINRIFHIRISDPIKRDMIAATANVDVGTYV